MLRLEFPNETHREMYEDMLEEWSQEDDFKDTSPGALFHGKSYEEFLEITQKVFKGEYLDYTPSTLFFLIEGDVLVGGIDIRHNIDAVYLQEYAGHIGYGIRPSKRKQGYATRILELGLKEAQKLEIQKALVCCYDNNIGSNKVIQVNGGILEKKAKHEDGTYFNRYWITL